LCAYLIALANEGGGKIVLGVTNKKPRKVVGTNAFLDLIKIKEKIFNKIHRRVDIEEIDYDGKRVLIFYIFSRPIGEALEFNGRRLMRSGGNLVPMSSEKLKEVINEPIMDYSSKIVEGTSLENDLLDKAIKELRKLLKQSGRVDRNINSLSDKQLLIDLNLISDKGVSLASLILLGKQQSIKKHLPFSEIRFGYKLNEETIRNEDVAIYDECYLLYYNKIWEKINSRNLSLSVPEGLLLLEKKAFDEETIREAINNAIIHRDYSEGEAIIIIQTRKNFNIDSPGGLPEGITIENMVDRTKPRNKLIADVLFKCGFVEQFGNGVDLMIKKQLSLGKSFPDYSKTDKYHVRLKIDGTIQDIEFAKYIYRIANKKEEPLDDKELIILNKIKNNEEVDSKEITTKLLNLGFIESIGRGKYILSKKYYQRVNKRGVYTRRKGLDKETNKALILKHLKHHNKGYMRDFLQVLPGIPKGTINRYLSELRNEEKIELIGNRHISIGPKAVYWQIKKKGDF